MERGERDRRLRDLYDRYHADLDAYCRRRLPEAQATDIVSEVFVTAWRRLEDVPDAAQLPWLYGIAKRVIANHRRSLKRQARLGERLRSQPADFVPDADVPVVRREEDRLVLAALERLSPLDQEVLRLRAWEEMSSAEIGTVMGITAAAVDMRLTRARRRMERSLRSVGFFDSVSSLRTVTNGDPS